MNLLKIKTLGTKILPSGKGVDYIISGINQEIEINLENIDIIVPYSSLPYNSDFCVYINNYKMTIDEENYNKIKEANTKIQNLKNL